MQCQPSFSYISKAMFGQNVYILIFVKRTRFICKFLYRKALSKRTNTSPINTRTWPRLQFSGRENSKTVIKKEFLLESQKPVFYSSAGTWLYLTSTFIHCNLCHVERPTMSLYIPKLPNKKRKMFHRVISLPVGLSGLCRYVI